MLTTKLHINRSISSRRSCEGVKTIKQEFPGICEAAPWSSWDDLEI